MFLTRIVVAITGQMEYLDNPEYNVSGFVDSQPRLVNDSSLSREFTSKLYMPPRPHHRGSKIEPYRAFGETLSTPKQTQKNVAAAKQSCLLSDFLENLKPHCHIKEKNRFLLFIGEGR